jgi:PAS domain S-box-containing protein
LADWLFPVLKTWPTPRASGETLLFQRDGDQVLYLNELQHRLPVKHPVPMATEKQLTAQVLRGEALLGRSVEGLDYRGIPVIGVVRSISGTDWFLVVKIDQTELYAETVSDAVWIGFVGFLALFVAGAGIYLMRKGQQLAVAQAIQQTQAERLNAQHLLSSIADSSDDAIFAKDLAGRYILINRAASQFVGKSAEDILGQDDRAMFTPEQAERLMAFNRRVIAENRTITQEEVLDTQEGERTFLTTKGPLCDNQAHVIGTFGISRDITERKMAEAELIQRNNELERFNRAMVGRVLDMIALKQQVNEFSQQLGQGRPYPLAFLDTRSAQQAGEDGP